MTEVHGEFGEPKYAEYARGFRFSAEQIELLYYAQEPLVLDIVRSVAALSLLHRKFALDFLNSAGDFVNLPQVGYQTERR